MRGVSRWWAAAALAMALVALLAPGAYAEDEPSPFDPPQARIQPPTGVTADARIRPPTGDEAQARIRPPSGDETQARIQPPSGIATQAFELVLLWLRARIGVPVG